VLCGFCGQKIWQQRISTKKCCPCTVNIACHVKQSSKTTSFGGTLSWQWRGGKNNVRVVLTATTRILHRKFPGTCETVGQVFKFVWRMRWKINVLYVIIPIHFFSITICNLLIDFPLYKKSNKCIQNIWQKSHGIGLLGHQGRDETIILNVYSFCENIPYQRVNAV